jgi:SAM-dependent MidA family methyltransferase
LEPALTSLLRERVTVSGSISFFEFMEHCLYHPEFGYYSSGRKVVGREGDFYTSVSTGSLFGRLLADEFYQVWLDLGKPAEWRIVEQGANRGELAADLLRRLREVDEAAWRACQYVLVEPHPALRAIQRQTLAGENIRQISTDELAEQSIRGVFFSNELADALPVQCVKFSGGEWRELRVSWDADGEKFTWREMPCDQLLAWRIAEWKIPAGEGYCAEISPRLGDWAASVARCLAEGIFLTIDYGGLAEELYTPNRREGTLRAYRRHRQMADVLAAPGEQDLTAHVNFSRLIASGGQGGLRLREYTDQRRYLTRLGQRRFFQEMERSPSAKLLREFQTLTHPASMGVVFKALTLTV